MGGFEDLEIGVPYPPVRAMVGLVIIFSAVPKFLK
jgi:hypothetical protein